jgi:hypothetical protein
MSRTNNCLRRIAYVRRNFASTSSLPSSIAAGANPALDTPIAPKPQTTNFGLLKVFSKFIISINFQPPPFEGDYGGLGQHVGWC